VKAFLNVKALLRSKFGVKGFFYLHVKAIWSFHVKAFFPVKAFSGARFLARVNWQWFPFLPGNGNYSYYYLVIVIIPIPTERSFGFHQTQ